MKKMSKLAPDVAAAVCGYPFDSMVCVAPAGHEGAHVTDPNAGMVVVPMLDEDLLLAAMHK